MPMLFTNFIGSSRRDLRVGGSFPFCWVFCGDREVYMHQLSLFVWHFDVLAKKRHGRRRPAAVYVWVTSVWLQPIIIMQDWCTVDQARSRYGY